MSAVTVKSRRRLSAEEYLETEVKASHKSEFFRGEVFAMAGGSEPHALIAGNLIGAFWSRLRGGSCRTYTSDLRVHVPRLGLYTYPDLTVVCGPAQFAPGAHQNLINPHLISEVCSRSTESYDRGDKFLIFQSAPTLQDYILVQQDRAFVEHFHRTVGVEHNQWLYTSVGDPQDSMVGLKAVLKLPSLGIEIPLAEIYTGVELASFLPLPVEPEMDDDIPPHPSLSPK